MVERAFTVGTAPAFSVSQWPRRSIVNEFIFVVHLLPLLRARILKIWIFFVWYLLVLVWYLFVATCPLVFVPRRLASFVLGILSVLSSLLLLSLTVRMYHDARITVAFHHHLHKLCGLDGLARSSIRCGMCGGVGGRVVLERPAKQETKRPRRRILLVATTFGDCLLRQFHAVLQRHAAIGAANGGTRTTNSTAAAAAAATGNHHNNCSTSSSAAGLLSARRSLAAVAVGTGQRHVQEICHGAGRTGGWRRK